MKWLVRMQKRRCRLIKWKSFLTDRPLANGSRARTGLKYNFGLDRKKQHGNPDRKKQLGFSDTSDWEPFRNGCVRQLKIDASTLRGLNWDCFLFTSCKQSVCKTENSLILKSLSVSFDEIRFVYSTVREKIWISKKKTSVKYFCLQKTGFWSVR